MRIRQALHVVWALLLPAILLTGVLTQRSFAAQQSADASAKASKKKPGNTPAAAKNAGGDRTAKSQPLSKGDELSEEQAGARDFALPSDDDSKPAAAPAPKRTAQGKTPSKSAPPPHAKDAKNKGSSPQNK